MLRWRIILGAGFVIGLAALCWLDSHARRPGVYLAGLAIVAAYLAAGEMVRLFRAAGQKPNAGLVYAASIAPVVFTCLPGLFPNLILNFSMGSAGWLAMGLVLSLAGVMIAEMTSYRGESGATQRLGLAALAGLYVGGCLGMLVQLRLINAPSDVGGLRGLFPLLTLIGTVKLSDICQYVVGRLTGRHKLAPYLSPGKTWEGAIGGIALASFIAACAIAWTTQEKNGFRASYFPMVWAYTTMVCVAGLIGDLAESLLKRDAGVKDSSDWMPGFGGVLDLLDSLLLSAPIAYAWWFVGVLGP